MVEVGYLQHPNIQAHAMKNPCDYMYIMQDTLLPPSCIFSSNFIQFAAAKYSSG